MIREGRTDSIFYVHKDYLGSLLTFTGEDGSILHEQNFDAWGRYRNIKDGSYVNVPSRPRWMYRGYTGHEHLEQQGLDVGYFDLINMNARLYDPINGRLLSPDNFVHDGAGTQGYNRYTYANNNPLKYTDPDGNTPAFVLAGALVGGLINLSFQAIKGNIHNFKDGLKAFGTGALGGALTTLGATSLSAAIATSITSSLSSQLPSWNIPIGNNFTLSISPALIFGTEGISMGINLAGSLKIGDFSFGAGASFSGFESDLLLGRSSESRWFVGGGYDDGNFGVSYYRNSYSKPAAQVTGLLSLRYKAFSLSVDEDFFPRPFADGQDRYRTGAIRFGIYDFYIGATIITGDPGKSGNRHTAEYPNHNKGYYDQEINTHRFSGVGIGYKFNGNSYEAGLTGEVIRAGKNGNGGLQNGTHNLTNDPYFIGLKEQYPLRPYSFYGKFNPFSLYQ